MAQDGQVETSKVGKYEELSNTFNGLAGKKNMHDLVCTLLGKEFGN